MIRTLPTGLAFGAATLFTALAAMAHEGHRHAAAAAEAAGDEPPQVVRWELMDEVGKNTQTLGGMAKGEIPFDAAEARAALDTIAANTEEFVTLFPEGTETGHETRALPAIWERKDEFEAQAQDSIEAAMAAKAAADEGLDPFRAAFRDLGASCRACHEDFRAEED